MKSIRKLSNNIRLTALISQVCIELTPRRDMCSKTCNSHQLLKKNSSCPVFKRETDLFGRLVNVETVLLCDTGMFLRKSFSNRSSSKSDTTLQYFTEATPSAYQKCFVRWYEDINSFFFSLCIIFSWSKGFQVCVSNSFFSVCFVC